MSTAITYRKGAKKDIPAFLAFFKTNLPSLFSFYSLNSIGYTVEVDYGSQFLTKKYFSSQSS
jgi:hypothetical protein